MQKENEVIALQKQGLGYRRIASALGLSPNTVKDYCKRHPYIPDIKRCPQCGAVLQNTPHKREKKFCSDINSINIQAFFRSSNGLLS